MYVFLLMDMGLGPNPLSGFEGRSSLSGDERGV